MTISYNWLCEYLPESISPERLSSILTSIGLEVESMEAYESVKGGLKGLVIGEVLECEKHPDADKLSLTKVNIGATDVLQIVCGAPNVAVGQKVVVATIGATIYPSSGEPLTMKKAKIRGAESHGMICAEDEIGLGNSHAGILVLPQDVVVGQAAADYFKPYEDIIFEIGLTPNRMDAMSHLGVARDVCAYLSHHDKKRIEVKSPFKNSFTTEKKSNIIKIIIEDQLACQRYAGVVIEGVKVGESPEWLKYKLKSIGLKPINNIVDITNFILHETGQPLHAFDLSAIQGNAINIKSLSAGTSFITLDEKERKLLATDLMICNEQGPMCMAGVYGGLHSGVAATTTDIFLESAWFNPGTIRKTSLAHGLRTDAATRFEKGVDISNVVEVLKRAALLISEIGGGVIPSELMDVYPKPKKKAQVSLSFHYLKKLSGKHYHADAVKNILVALGFEILREGIDAISVAVPFSKPDITIPADIVEEIMRIDGLDNIDIPSLISISPAVEKNHQPDLYKQKVTGYLTGLGFHEIFTNSITNANYYNASKQGQVVKMMNSLSADLNAMRLSMLETGLESVAYNLNRKNNDLRLFEFGKTYQTDGDGKYFEQQHLSLFVTGNKIVGGWNSKAEKADYYYARGVASKLLQLIGINQFSISYEPSEEFGHACSFTYKNNPLAIVGAVHTDILQRFDIKQSVYFIDLNWDALMKVAISARISYSEIPKFPSVQRDLAIVVEKSVRFEDIEKITTETKLKKLVSLHLFDIFESEKLGAGKKSMALNFLFLDEEKTLTDKEIEAMMQKLMEAYEKNLQAEVRKG